VFGCWVSWLVVSEGSDAREAGRERGGGQQGREGEAIGRDRAPTPRPRGQKMRRAVAAAAPTSAARRLAASVRPEEWLGWY